MMLFKKRTADTGNFRLEHESAGNVLRFLPEVPFARVRFYMRGPLMDGYDGNMEVIQDHLARAGEARRPLIAPRQVHGVEIVEAAPFCALPARPEADGILLASLDVEASLRFADCAPVLILPSEEWTRHNRPWALLLHSGYKGTVQNIVRAGLRRVEQVMGRDASASASAWVGPCIGGEDYPRKLEEWTERGLAAFHPENVRESDGHYYFDLAGELQRQLLECGIAPHNIFVSGLNTAETPECYSYRRGDKIGRMMLHVCLFMA
ncbi:MAG: polyphenol oxidase family protein [Fretibacterium sp.]|nr:polyphenol oxidase family protein [Fretibacterium sp.]